MARRETRKARMTRKGHSKNTRGKKNAGARSRFQGGGKNRRDHSVRNREWSFRKKVDRKKRRIDEERGDDGDNHRVNDATEV